jgi:hypothetical protein
MRRLFEMRCRSTEAPRFSARRQHTKHLYWTPKLEALEDRAVPTVLFTPQYGAETVFDTHGYKLSSPPIYLIFWGTYWTTTDGNTYANNLVDAAKRVISSDYLSRLTQYFNDGQASYGAPWIILSDPSSGFSTRDIDNVVQSAIDDPSSPIPESDSGPHEPIYVVVTPPDIVSDQSDDGGYHTMFHDQDLPSDYDDLPEAWVGTDGTIDTFSDAFSHEVAETMTDPIPNQGITVSPGSSFTDVTAPEICDNEAEYYDYRVNNSLVQSYWSYEDSAYIVPDGNHQTLTVNNGELQIAGDQFGAFYPDSITIDVAPPSVYASQTQIQVTLNGEAYSFDQSVISSIAISPGSGQNTINVRQTAPGVSVFIQESSSDTVTLGNGYNARGIHSPVTISNPGSYTDLWVLDSSDQTSRTVHVYNDHVTGLTPYPVYFGQSDLNSLHLWGGTADTFYVHDTPTTPDKTYIVTGQGLSEVDVQATTGSLDINSLQAPTAVNIGSQAPAIDGTLTAIRGPVSVSNSGAFSSITVCDSADTVGHTVTVTNARITGLAPVPITYKQSALSALTIQAGTNDNPFGSGSTFNVQSTPNSAPTPGNTTTTIDSRGFDVVNVGRNRLVSGIVGTLWIINPVSLTTLNIDDSADTTGRSVNISANVIDGLAPGFIEYTQSGLNALNINAGTSIIPFSGSTFDVLSTPNWGLIPGNVTTSIDSRGVDTVMVGEDGQVDGIQGNLKISNPTDGTLLIIDDSGDSTSEAATVTASAVTGLSPGTISYDQAGLIGLTINGGTGGTTLDVLSTPNFGLIPGNETTTFTSNGNDIINVGDNGSLQGIRGNVAIATNSGGSPALVVDDSADSTPQSAVEISATDVNSLAPGDISYGMLASLKVRAGLGDDTVKLTGPLPTFPVIVGGVGGTNTLVGPNQAATWVINALNGGKLGTVAFANFQNLVGGSGNDRYQFTLTGGIAGTLDGGAGTNRLDYSGNGGTPVTVNLRTAAAPRIKSGNAGGFSRIQFLVGGPSANDTLTGPNTQTLWRITGNNTGQVAGMAFVGIEHLFGGTASDTFKISPAGRVVSIRGGGNPGDWLDFSLFPSGSPVNVNLATGSASGVGGGSAGAVAGVRNVLGGAGNDTIIGNTLGNILIGGAGNDTLTAGPGRSLLIGGVGSDTIRGGHGDDILISGKTSFDAAPSALLAFLSEWQRTDRTYAQRVADLKNGGGLNGTNRLVWGTTVLDDGAADMLTGAAGLDWYFANIAGAGTRDTITDRNTPGPEQVN